MAKQDVSRQVYSRVLDETLAYLVSCCRPKMIEFIHFVNNHRDTNIMGGPNNFIEQQIREKFGTAYPEQDLIDFVDGLHEHGSQHIFLYRIPQEAMARVRLLKNSTNLNAMLKKHGILGLLEKPLLVWDSVKPQLAAIFFNTTRNILTFKWVETRSWTSNQVMPVPAKVNKKERSVNFFRMNLDTGECEVCLQKLHSNPKLSLQAEHDLYLGMAKEMFGLEQLLRVPLEPTIRRLLESHHIHTRSWRVAYEKGGELKGRRDPNLAQRINLFWTPFVGLDLKGAWKDGRKSGALVSFDSKNDEVFIQNRFETLEKMTDMLRKVRDYSEMKIQNAQLREAAQKHEHLMMSIAAVDMSLARAQKNVLDLRRVADSRWIPQDEMLETARQIEKMHRKDERFDKFRVTYQVLCPDSKEVVLDENKKSVEFSTFEEIPTKVSCRHAYPQGMVKHPTKGNIRPILHILPAPSFWDVGLVGYAQRPSGFLSFMQKQFGEKLGTAFVKILAGMICTLPAVAIILGIGWTMLEALERFPEQEGILVATFATLMILLILTLFIFLVALFGKPVFQTALDGLKNFVEIIRKWFSILLKHKNEQKGTPHKRTAKSKFLSLRGGR